MEVRESEGNARMTARPVISRRSCDQCRARKIRCDRESPCSNCNSAKLDCTHSAVASNTQPPRQRISLSTQYEEKIDEIAKGISGIQILLQTSQNNAVSHATDPQSTVKWEPDKTDVLKNAVREWPDYSSAHRPLDEQDAYLTSFIRRIVHDVNVYNGSNEDCRTVSRLAKFLKLLDEPQPTRMPDRTMPGRTEQQMPPMEAGLEVLRWAKTHHSCGRMFWLSRILPQERFMEACRKVYFAIDDYDSLDLALANAYLFYVFAEYAVELKSQKSQEYRDQCRKNFHDILVQLPLLLRPSLEAIAVLTLGAFHAIEDSTVSLAWTYISTAMNLCQSLGYHRAPTYRNTNQSLRAIETHLFWTVYRCERAAALRIGRSSNIRDTDIVIPIDSIDAYFSKVGRIQGQIYDHLYSPSALAQPTNQHRSDMAESLATELRDLIRNMSDEITAGRQYQSDFQVHNNEDVGYQNSLISPCSGSDCRCDSTRLLYMQFDLMCHYSSLALVLRATPASTNTLYEASDECITVARHALDTHEQYMKILHNNTDPLLVTKYINWAIINAPFVPFSILFTRVIQHWDLADLERLERFATSLQPEIKSSGLGTYPCQLYELLCRAARMYITRYDPITTMNDRYFNTEGDDGAEIMPLQDWDNTVPLQPQQNFSTAGEDFEYSATMSPSRSWTLGDWYHGNQQVMGLLDEDFMF